MTTHRPKSPDARTVVDHDSYEAVHSASPAQRRMVDYGAHVAALVAAAPPLSPSQRDRIASLLRPSTDDSLADARPDDSFEDLEEVIGNERSI